MNGGPDPREHQAIGCGPMTPGGGPLEEASPADDPGAISDSSPAFAAALELLARRDHFRADLEQRLHRKGLDPGDVAAALRRCDHLGLVDDQGLAGRFVELRAADRGWGPRRLELELRRRGVEQTLAEHAARLTPELHEKALALALARAEARAPSGWWRLPARRARMLSSLVNRGFEADDARRAVDDLARHRESQQHANHDLTGDP